MLAGVAASPGVAIGTGPALGGVVVRAQPDDRVAEDAGVERTRLRTARVAAADRDRRRSRADRRAPARADAEAAIFDAHLALLDDEALLDAGTAAIDRGATAERAWYDAAAQVAASYRALDDPLLRERATDVLDVGAARASAR